MKTYSNPEELLARVPQSGDSFNFQHSCATVSSKNRASAVIKRGNSGVYWNCFRCGEKGRIGKKVYFKSYFKDTDKEIASRDLPDDLEEIDYESAVSEWLKKAGLTREEIKRGGFKWSPRVQRIFYPCRQPDNTVGAWQARAIRSEDLRSRKYDTYFPEGHRSTHCFVPCSSSAKMDALVITEDYLSAIRCARFTDSLALGTTTLKKDTLLDIVEHYPKILLALDNDRGGHKGAAKLLKSLRMYRQVIDLKLPEDPKSMLHEELGQWIIQN